MNLKNVLDKEIESLRPVEVLNRSINKGRLPHGVLLHGEDFDVLRSVCFALAARLLESDRSPLQHPDFFSVRPSNKMRQISADNVRALNKQLQQSANQRGRKVAVVFEADRMNVNAANAFLKTLEEPPSDTTIFLLTTRPYDLLDTIRSRCLNFKIPTILEKFNHPEWDKWLQAYAKWMRKAFALPKSTQDTADIILSVYGLVARFKNFLSILSENEWKKLKETLPDELEEEEIDALEAGVYKKYRNLLFAEIERKTMEVAVSIPPVPPSVKLARVIVHIEQLKNLFEVNFSETTALESFLLDSLRVWSL
ncbi:MAG: hypothetical protein A2007_04910 [Verrucomicrobia bacterium GWC2_42_7]|nr:MAG: hypothetical protein A2007_04910 [Verrucomicrobia bacterium GWC2_42_7]